MVPGKTDGTDKDGNKSEKDKKTEAEGEAASMSEMLMLAERYDYVLLGLGIFGSCINGLGDPLLMVFFTEALKELSGDPEEILDAMTIVAYYMIGLGVLMLFGGILQYGAFTMFSKRMAQKLRESWFRAVMRQNIGWFDVNNPGEMPGRISSSIVQYEEGVGRKMAEFFQFSTTTICGLIIGFFYNIYVSLLIFGVVPLIGVAGYYLVTINTNAAEFKDKSYGKANAVAYEIFSSLKTLLSLNATEHLGKKYFDEIRSAEKEGIKRSWYVGFANAGMLDSFVIMYLLISVFGGWMLVKQIREIGCDPSGSAPSRNKCDYFDLPQEVSGMGILITTFCVAFGGQSMGQMATAIDAFATGRKAAKPGFDVIQRVPPIDVTSSEGYTDYKDSSDEYSKNNAPCIELKNVKFSYPARPENLVCDDYTLKIQPGTTMALVGESGSGKSTIMNLVQRFYDVDSGSVFVGGHDIKDWNVSALRSKISLVGQEPRLFSGTIGENIANGAISDMELYKKITQEDIEKAAIMANAHQFIMKFPQGYQTQVGHGGTQMSGGQKQRIAIARSLIKNPAVLLLDEATSALDNKSEKVVQNALDKLLQDGNTRTTLIIAHRLSTIRNADLIAFIKDGKVVEIGNHEELMNNPASLYKGLVEAQATTVDATIEKNVTSIGSDMDKLDADDDVVVEPSVSIVNSKIEPTTDHAKNAVYPSEIENGVVNKEVDKKTEEEEYPITWERVWDLNRPDQNLLLTGLVGSVITGLMYPAWGLVFGWMFTAFYKPVPKCTSIFNNDGTPTYSTDENSAICDAYYDDQADDLWDDIIFLVYAWVFIIIGLLIGNVMLFYGFGAASERLSRRVREIMYNCYIRQEPGYFDLPENSVGAVTGRLATDATLIKSRTGEPIQRIFVTIFALGGGIAVSGYFCWPVCLMSIATLPFVGAALDLQMQVMLGTGERVQAEDSESSSIVGEAIHSIKTVVSLGLEDTLVKQYNLVSSKDLSTLEKDSLYIGTVMGLAVAINHWDWALLMWWGAYILYHHSYAFTFEDFNIALFAFFFGMFGLAAAGAGMADANEAKDACRNVFTLMDRITTIDPFDDKGVKDVSIKGSIKLDKVNFTYPARLHLQVCNDYTLDIPAGKSIGLVGQSGSGKSTAIQLIERFYDTNNGTVSLDGMDVKSINYKFLHGQLGLVGQEPVLYKGSVAENIWLGCPIDKDRDKIDMDLVNIAAKAANAHEFISAFPEGYETDVGTAGERLSGGQKQRVAIARALVTNPKILLLDEATSALDTDSEKVVQNALDNLIKKENITTVTIAHRLSTVQDLDVIHVVQNGAIVESGSHGELMNQNGKYKELVTSTSSS